MKTILFVIDTLHGGGAARVTVLLANELTKNMYKVGIATNLSTRDCNYTVNPDVTLFNIYGLNAMSSNAMVKLGDHTYRLRSVIKEFKPDIIIGEQENGLLYSKLSAIFTGIPIIGHRHNSFKILGLSQFQTVLFNSVDKSVLLHNTDVKWVGKRIKNTVAIYNPCTFRINHVPQDSKQKIIAVVGSTKRYLDKGFDIALDVWGRLAHDFPEWKLHIIGGGSEANEQKLKDQILYLNIQKQVVMTGFVNDVEQRLREASIFLLPSRVEGFPMVINEAISQGCACASFRLSGVMAELYTDSAVLKAEDNDIKTFESNLRKMLKNKDLRASLSKASQTELLKYEPAEIVKDWIKIINELS